MILRRTLEVVFSSILLVGCGTLADAWVRRDFRADRDVAGFSSGTETSLKPFHAPEASIRDLQGRAAGGLHPVTAQAMGSACPTPRAAAYRTERTRTLGLGVGGAVIASIVLAVGDMIIVEAGAQLDDASDRLINELTSTSAAAVNVARLMPGSGAACFVMTRTHGKGTPMEGTDNARLWEFGFSIKSLEGASGAIVIEPISLVFERSAALTQDGTPIDLNFTVSLQAPGQNNLMLTHGSSDFRVRGARPTIGPQSPNLLQQHLRPRGGTAFVGPGDRFAVLSVVATEMGSGAENIEREKAFRERHQGAVTDLLRAISADRLGVERLPGRSDR